MLTPTRRPVARACLVTLCLSLAALPVAGAQERNGAAAEPAYDSILTGERYLRPPAGIERLVTAPRQKNITLNNQGPDRRYFVSLQSDGLPDIDRFGKPHHYLGGLQVDFRANRVRSLTTRGADALAITDAAGGQGRRIQAPSGATISSPAWSPDGHRLAFIANFDDASRLWIADVATGKARQLSATPLLATLVTDVRWTGDGRNVVAVVVPEGRKGEPQQPAVETGPLVRLTDPAKNPTRTYASLLRDPVEKAMLEYYTTGQLAMVDAASGAVRRIGAPAMIADVDPSPDGKYFRVTVMEKPFSYIVPYSSFGQSEQLWDASGRRITQLGTRPARLGDGGGDDQAPGAASGDSARRDFGWMPDGQGLYFLQQDPAPAPAGGDSAAISAATGRVMAAPAGDSAAGGRPAPAARRRDRLYRWTAPFETSAPKVLLESDNRIGSVLFSEDASMAFVAENANGTGHVYATYFNEPGKRYTIWRMRGLTASVGGTRRGFGGGRGGTGADSVTFYLNPGEPMSKPGRLGGQVAMLSPDGSSAYLSGIRYARAWQDSAPRGFLDRVDVRTGRKTRMFESEAGVFETVAAALDDEVSRIVVTRQSPTLVPNGYVRDLKGGTLTKLTDNQDYTPEFTRLVRKKVPVTRADGTRFFVDLTLPQDYRAGTRLPGMLWFYPYEYTDQAGYDRTLRTENVNEFPSSGPRTIEYLATLGYAVVNFSPPIIGERGRMNDNYVADLRNNLDAVINELERQGYIDRTRLGIGGHSYGAFSTVNAMVHTPYFRAGIAGDGMYNRSLTPNGFQSERRDFWEGQRTYLEMSPFFYADRMSGALLMYHSIEDQNVGTAPISSIRMMHALESLGKTAALYMYPYEDHGPAAEETILDQWARWVAWLDSYVKNPDRQTAARKVAAEGR